MMDKLPAIYNSSFPIAVLLVVFNCVWREALNLCFVDAENIFSHLELINEIKAPSSSISSSDGSPQSWIISFTKVS